MPHEHDHGASSPQAHPHGEHPAVHGMLIVGEIRVLMSHLPMFHSPHDYQMLLETTLSAPGSDPFKTYLKDRKASMEKVYTWVPKPFQLSVLAANPPAPLTMMGSIFRGHFERGGVAITADDVEAKVTRVLYARRLTPETPPPADLRYLIFGSPAEAFVAHRIARAPDFDQIMAAKFTTPAPDWLKAWDGAAIELGVAGTGHSPGVPLQQGAEVQVTRLDNQAAETFTLSLPTEFYLETGDLAN
ncbi:hypothetical protein [Bradyrhizobium sp.]|uniref:hypothetical protein n=1 Tax=Bradyrhizobium sp. TaxID=376 RepID=UPI002DF9CFF1|nr:hypothetical protein [Bradyrhizobium sp.]